jgi:hypothetical protein
VDFLKNYRLMVDAANACLVQQGTNRRYSAITRTSGPMAAVVTGFSTQQSSATCGKLGGGRLQGSHLR